MSDLLAPVLCEIKCEAEAFWCFVGLMQRTIFVCTPTDNDMDNNLVRNLHDLICNERKLVELKHCNLLFYVLLVFLK